MPFIPLMRKVRDHQVGFHFRDLLQRFARVAGFAAYFHVRFTVDDSGDALPNNLMIFDEQNLGFSRRFGFHGFTPLVGKEQVTIVPRGRARRTSSEPPIIVAR